MTYCENWYSVNYWNADFDFDVSFWKCLIVSKNSSSNYLSTILGLYLFDFGQYHKSIHHNRFSISGRNENETRQKFSLIF